MEMNLHRLTPELILLGVSFILLIIDLFMRKVPGRRAFGVIGIIGSLAAGVSLVSQTDGMALAGLFVQDGASIFFKWLFAVIAVVVLYTAMVYEGNIREWKGEFYSLVTFAATGMMLLASSADFVSFYVTLEFLAVTQYVLAAYTRDNPYTVEAGLKYLITGALASGFLLYGISFIYGSTGVTGFEAVGETVATSGAGGFLVIGLTLVVIGLTFKISSLPFHVWTPDVYQGAPTPVTALLAAGSKAAGFIVMLRILFTALGTVKGEWVILVSIISGATLLFGNLAAMPQKDIKRLMAYASIGSAGYILMAVASASELGVGAIMFYLLTYAFAILGSFLAIVVFYNSERSDLIENYAGLSRRSPLLAGTLFIGLLSLAGVPPLGGFIAKFYLIASAVRSDLLVLAVIGVVMAIVSMYYFLLVIRSMYLRPPRKTDPIPVDPVTRTVLYIINIVVIMLGVYPGPVTDLVMDIAKVFF